MSLHEVELYFEYDWEKKKIPNTEELQVGFQGIYSCHCLQTVYQKTNLVSRNSLSR